jgi:hypothetical protein
VCQSRPLRANREASMASTLGPVLVRPQWKPLPES